MSIDDIASLKNNPELRALIKNAGNAAHMVQLEKREANQELNRSIQLSTLRDRVRQSGLCVSDSVVQSAALGELQNTPALRAVRDWWKGGQHLLVLAGGVGVGKTVAALLHLATVGPPPVGVVAPELARRQTPRKEDRDLPSFKPLERRAPVIILDDLGTEKRTDHWLAEFHSFIDTRHVHGRTVITTNLGDKSIAKLYGERTLSRMQQAGKFVGLPNKSLREKQEGWS